MKRFAAALFALVLAAGAAPAHAATDAATADTLLRDSGLWEQLGDIVEQVRSELDTAVAQSANKPDRAEVERFGRLIDAAYAPERLRIIARQAMLRGASARTCSRRTRAPRPESGQAGGGDQSLARQRAATLRILSESSMSSSPLP